MRHLNFKYLFRLCAHTDTTSATFFNPRNRRRRWVDWAVEERVTMLQNFLVDMLCALCGSTAVFSFFFSDFSAPLSLFLVALMLRHLFDNRRVGKRARERGKIDKICFQTLTTRLRKWIAQFRLSYQTALEHTKLISVVQKKETRESCETAEIYHRRYPATMEDIFVFPSWLILS